MSETEPQIRLLVSARDAASINRYDIDHAHIHRDWPPGHMDMVTYAEHLAALAERDHEFKNFHRLLCERFGYVHDEVDWKRDQISLIEHIAAALAERDGLLTFIALLAHARWESAPDDYDPTPWCAHCGAMRKADCHCGPIPQND